jgi:HTH-type transcriptional regulator, competence development regulator
MNKDKTFGEIVREARLKINITLRKFASEMALSPTFVSKMEVGEYMPPKEENIIKIAEFLGLDKDELLAKASKVSSDIQNTILENPKLYASFLRKVDTEEIEEILNKLK